MRVLVEYCDEAPANRERTYHIKAIIDCERQSKGLIIVSDKMNHLCKLLRDVSDIEGVIDCSHGRHALTVRRSPAYEWDEIEDKVLAAIAEQVKRNVHELDIEREETSLYRFQP